MSNAKWNNQSGSSIVFVIVGLVLAVGLVATVYFVNQRGEVVRREQDIAAYNKSQADKNATDEVSNNEIVNVVDVKNDSNNALLASAQASVLPVTGPENIFIVLLGLGLSVATTVSYSLSRRNLSRYL